MRESRAPSRRTRHARTLERVAIGVGTGALATAAQALPPVVTTYETLNFGTADTFLTGIRGDNIVGNYVIPGTTETGGLFYDMTTETWSAMPVATPMAPIFPAPSARRPMGRASATPAASCAWSAATRPRPRRPTISAISMTAPPRRARASRRWSIPAVRRDAVHHRPQHLRQSGGRQLRHPARDRQRLHLQHRYRHLHDQQHSRRHQHHGLRHLWRQDRRRLWRGRWSAAASAPSTATSTTRPPTPMTPMTIPARSPPISRASPAPAGPTNTISSPTGSPPTAPCTRPSCMSTRSAS